MSKGVCRALKSRASPLLDGRLINIRSSVIPSATLLRLQTYCAGAKRPKQKADIMVISATCTVQTVTSLNPKQKTPFKFSRLFIGRFKSTKKKRIISTISGVVGALVFNVCVSSGLFDRLCSLVITVPRYSSRGPGSIPGATRFSEK
jgi:hypothetical protein